MLTSFGELQREIVPNAARRTSARVSWSWKELSLRLSRLVAVPTP